METKRRPRLTLVPTRPVGGRCCPAAARAEAVLDHYEIGVRTFCAGVPVDWAHVAYRMAQALAGADDDAPEGRP